MPLGELSGIKGTRDRALLLIGFAGAFCRNELVSLTVANTEHTKQGVIIHLTRSKTEQEGRGRKVVAECSDADHRSQPPSGVAEPSRADEMLANSLKQAQALVDVRMLDHFIVAGSMVICFSDRGLM